MALERGFRRIVLAFSLVAFAVGLAFSIVLAVAWGWTLSLDRQRVAALAEAGCPGEGQPSPAELSLMELNARRWRVTIPQRGYSEAYVITSNHALSRADVMGAISAPISDADFMQPRRHPTSGVELLDCTLENARLVSARDARVSNRLIYWWMERPGVMWSIAWTVFAGFDKHPWLIVPATIISPLLVLGAVAAIPWAVFYFVRWVAQGFAAKS